MAEMENSKDLISVLWSGADILRSKMDANEYKDYLLGIVFYKYLSDSFLIKVYDLIYDEKPGTLKEALEAYKEALEDESAEELKGQLSKECHYIMEPELTYTYFADAARNNSFNREQLQKGFNNIEQSDPIFADLFTDIDLYSNRLGAGDQKQSDTVASLIKEIDKADLLNSDTEILGNAYEYLIGQFASETGKKAGEFYTPQAVSKILTKIAISGQEDKKGLSVYDPCMGSGSLLLNAKKYASAPEYIKYYGQEQNTSTYNLARMNMFLHGIVAENQHLRNGDTLDGDWPTGEETDFNMVLMNPPYSASAQNEPLYENEIAFVLSDVPNGRAIARTFLIDRSGKYTLNQRIAGITPHEDTDPYYLYIKMNRNAYFLKFDDGNKQTNLSIKDVLNYEDMYPSYTEQQKIGEYFCDLDHLITLHHRKCEEMKILKKYMLQKMFPQNGNSVPEIRFLGFTEDWEQRKFSEMVTIERGGSPRPIDKFITNDKNGLNWVKIGDAPEQGNYITQTAEKIRPEGLSKTREVHPGDLILSNSMSFGRPYIMAIDGCIHDGWLAIRDTKKNFDLKFLCTLLGTDSMLNQYKAMAAGSTVNNLNKELVGGTIIAFPMLEEQIKIGDYFTSIDHLITLHQKKCDELRNIKKFMLQNMFI